MPRKQVKYIGVDISTGELKMIISDAGFNLAMKKTPMQGATTWNDGAAFDVNYLPFMLLFLISQFERDGWSFDKPGFIVFSVRQHDLVFVGENKQPIIPALSWQCNEGRQACRWLNSRDFVKPIVGPIEDRFIVAKASWALTVDGDLDEKTWRIMSTGDWAVGQLTGHWFLSTSDGLSNGLLVQDDKLSLAASVLETAGLSPTMFCEPAASDTIAGTIEPFVFQSDPWALLAHKLSGWKAGNSLGDNHAGAASCLGEDDDETIVVSCGTSGTATRVCANDANLVGKTAQFEFFNRRLLLSMLHRCADWYNSMLDENDLITTPHNELNQGAQEVGGLENLLLVTTNDQHETLPVDWDNLKDPQKVAVTQLSIARAMIRHVLNVFNEVTDTETAPSKCVLLGGLTQSPFFQEAFHAGLAVNFPNMTLYGSARPDDMGAQGAAMGALVIAVGHDRDDHKIVQTQLCPIKPLDISDERQTSMRQWFKRHPVD